MGKDILLRNVDPEVLAWLNSQTSLGRSQNELLQLAVAVGVEKLDRDQRAVTLPPGKFDFIDLFAGIGGFNLGMKANGGRCVFTSEWDKYAAKTYSAWHTTHSVETSDIRELDIKTSIPEHDVLLAGFPCQPFSIAGVSKKNSLGRAHGFDDAKQGNLFFAIAEIARIKKPPVMILENVKNLKGHDKGNTWSVISETLDQLGYEVRHEIIDARHWVPQHRERIFIVCFLRSRFLTSEIEDFRFPKRPDQSPKLKTILESAEPDPKYMLTDGLWLYLQEYAKKHKEKGNGFGFQLVGPEDVSRTMSARYYKDGSEILIDQPGWRNPRRLTPAEAARLMGFNKRFAKLNGHKSGFPQVVSDMQAYKQFGNSVSPLVVEALGKQVLEVLEARSQRLARSTSSNPS